MTQCNSIRMRISSCAVSLIVTADVGLWILNSIGLHKTTLAVGALNFLGSLNRPCFLIDVQAVQRWCSDQKTNDSDYGRTNAFLPIPSIYLPTSKECLVAMPIVDNPTNIPCDVADTFDASLNPIDILLDVNESDVSTDRFDTCFGYIHCQVVKMSSSQMLENTFLAQLNIALPWHKECCTSTVPAHLVLGLNNHHVVSYYWARSAGAGAAMEAPGISVVQPLSGNAQLRWASEVGYTECNSNDGKRSEWVKFLKDGDQVQLRPTDIEAAMHHFRDNIYGISMAGRPLGRLAFIFLVVKCLPFNVHTPRLPSYHQWRNHDSFECINNIPKPRDERKTVDQKVGIWRIALPSRWVRRVIYEFLRSPYGLVMSVSLDGIYE